MESLRNVFGSLWIAARHVRAWLFSWALFTIAAAVVVWPAWRALDAGLSHRPGAPLHLDLALDADLWRTRPELALQLGGALLFALLAGAFLAGGVLATVGRPERRFRFSQMLGEGGFLIARNLRVLGVGLVLALALGWGFDLLDGWLRGDRLRDVDAGAVAIRLGVADVRWFHLMEAIAWVRGFVFLGLVYAGKLAMARLVDGTRSSAVAAWTGALARLLRHPLRAVAVLALWTAIWGGGSHALGELTAWLLEVRQDLALGALAGQAGVVLGQWVLIGMLVSARRFARAV